MKEPIDIYYDDEGDFLEITIKNPPKESYCEDVNNDVFIRRDEESHDIIGLGILNFKEHTKELSSILKNVSLKISFETINSAS